MLTWFKNANKSSFIIEKIQKWRKCPALLNFPQQLGAKVENTCVGKQPRVEGEGNDRRVGLRPLPGEVLHLAWPKLDEPGDADDHQGEHLGVREVVLHLVGPLDLVAVDEAEDAEAGGGQEPHAGVGGITLGEEGLQDVQGERQGLDGGYRQGLH